MKWYILALKKYAVAAGRSRRKEYWMFCLVNILISLGLGFILGVLEGALGMDKTLSSAGNMIYSLATLVPSFAVGIRRMHDTGHNGWWLIFPLVNLYLACKEGDRGDNQYGSDPKAEASAN